MRTPATRYITTPDGLHLAWCEAGDGQPLLYLPAPTFSHCQLEWEHPYWTDWYEALVATGRRLIRYDQRGVGLSDRNVPLSLDTQVLDLLSVVDELGLASFDVLAVSAAAAYAVEFATRHPGRIEHLVLWAPIVRMSDQPEFVDAVRELARVDWPMFAKTAMGYGSQDAYDDEISRVAAGLWIEACDGQTFLEYRDALENLDLTDRLPDVFAPTLVIHPKVLDWPEMRVSQRTVTMLPDAAFVVVEGQDLRPTNADLARVAAIIGGFIDGRDVVPEPPATTSTAGVRTVLYTDVVDHTALMRRLGDDDGRRVLREHEELVRITLRAHGGVEVKTMGDGFLTWFSSTAAAVNCACDLQRACARRNETADERFDLRIGLSAGEPLDDDGDIFGAAVILASRITNEAGAGEIMVPDHVRQLVVGKGFAFRPRGPFTPKGFDEPIALFTVDWSPAEA